ncbi:copper chaperone PCu(A)C [Streptomyces sp. NRRL F-5126]|uniref:copper chaperone PCu(A)C n=1 Tax=Streptomyces sp. NRRL F-5126 TaxID=1463857 RepID=UPI0004CBF1A8|nr:copper chaperone PCu(A)C [Streptomyces sp. NRRL F-5126]
MIRRAPLALACVLAAAGLTLTACSDGSSAADAKAHAPEAPASATASAHPAAGGKPHLTVDGAYVPQPVGDLAAAFLVVKNTGGGDDTLTSVTSPVSGEVSIHKTVNDRMVEVKSFDVPAGGTLDLARGGNHIMLMGVKKPLKEGRHIALELHFRKTGAIKVNVPVKAANYQPAAAQ